jgi:phosphoribosylanthranilate isomerase
VTRVKVCGVTRPGDARAAAEAGASLVGMILWAPSPRSVDLAGAERVRDAIPEGVEAVGVFVDEDPDRVEELAERLRLDRVQLHGSEPEAVVRRFGARALRGVRDGDASQVPAGVPVVYDRAFGEHADERALEEHWRAARALGAERPVLLAGGLHAGNVGRAVAAARPFGVDVARGVESAPGIKDHDALRRFVAAAREGDDA